MGNIALVDGTRRIVMRLLSETRSVFEYLRQYQRCFYEQTMMIQFPKESSRASIPNLVGIYGDQQQSHDPSDSLKHVRNATQPKIRAEVLVNTLVSTVNRTILDNA